MKEKQFERLINTLYHIAVGLVTIYLAGLYIVFREPTLIICAIVAAIYVFYVGRMFEGKKKK
jgi:uncharacterized membrane protein YccC